jgi:hypothetical protein
LRQGALGSYDNFNMVTEGARGNLGIGIELIYDTLLLPSMDEASSAYGLLAEAVACPGASFRSSGSPRGSGYVTGAAAARRVSRVRMRDHSLNGNAS